uniref:Uncharacterized protein n=1 Tax=Ackermannviridae sp. ctClB2 TaxID=2825752 RepID=A0A8S5NZQ1_9CAUD|nr:MAG TPA: hypothetical protein [Ackermannviridae sp. ctClB2]
MCYRGIVIYTVSRFLNLNDKGDRRDDRPLLFCD